MKAADRGEAVVRFATLGVVDLDGDIIEPGAIGRQRVKVSAFGHTSWGGALPVGAGETRESGDAAIADVRFFLDTQHGRDHWETVKGLGDLQEYSFGFDVLEEARPSEEQRAAGAKRVLKRLTVHEVSPVFRGAGVGTGTLAMKARCTDCGAAVSGAALERRGRELVERARRTRASNRKTLERLEGIAQPDVGRQGLARFAVYCGHLLNGLPGRVRAPAVKWYDRASSPDLNGYIRLGVHETWIAADLEGADLVRTCLHEAKHLAQRDPEARDAEADARAFAAKWTKPVLAAYRHADGATWKVRTTTKRNPPFGGTRRSGDVVLHLGEASAWGYFPRAINAWKRL